MGTSADDILCGLGGTDTVRGLGGNDVVNGGRGSDFMSGGVGKDTLDYSDSSAGVTVTFSGTVDGNGYLTASGGHAAGDKHKGFEHLTGSSFGDFVIGDGGRNIISGASGDDYLAGNAGDDDLFGGAGEDLLDGRAGADLCIGGKGGTRSSTARRETPESFGLERKSGCQCGESSSETLAKSVDEIGSRKDPVSQRCRRQSISRENYERHDHEHDAEAEHVNRRTRLIRGNELGQKGKEEDGEFGLSRLRVIPA